jgi:hypothetical protein
MAAEARIEGVDQLCAVLRELPDRLARNALLSTARAGAMTLQKSCYAYLALAMRDRSPREDDVIIRQRRPKKGDAVQAEFGVGPPRGKPWLRWLNDGTAPHDITIRRRRVLFSERLKRFFGLTIHHPGQPPRKWMEAAVFASSEKVYAAMAVTLRKALPKQVQKLVSEKYRGAQVRGILRNVLH